MHAMGLQMLMPSLGKTDHARLDSEVRQILHENNSTAAEEISWGIREDLVRLRASWDNITTEFKEVFSMRKPLMGAASTTMHHMRRLFGISDTLDDVKCGFSSVIGGKPETYPCCKGLWCCSKPLIPAGWTFQRDWIVWNDDWVRNTRCEELQTYGDAFLFMLRGVCTSVRGINKGLPGVYPFDVLTDWVWSIFSFPGDQWPQSVLHPGYGAGYQTMCISLNMGLYVALLFAVYLVFFEGSMATWLSGWLCVYSDAFERVNLQDIEINRRDEERMVLRQAQQQHVLQSN